MELTRRRCPHIVIHGADADYAPLSAEPTTEDLTRLRTAIEAGDLGQPTRTRYGGKQRHGLLVFGVVGGFLGLIFGVMALVAAIRGNGEDALIGLGFVAGIVLVGAGAGWLGNRSEHRERRDVWRLVAFARANGLEVEPAAKVVLLPGTIFTTKHHAQTANRVCWTVGGLDVEVANHSRHPGGTSFTARYLAVPLTGAPRLTFVGRTKGPARPAQIVGTQVTLAAQGSPDRRRQGTLTSLTKDAARARAFMTDELVDLLTDREHPCNAEVVGGWFFAYSRTQTRPDESSWRHTFAVAEAAVRSATAASWQDSRPFGERST